MQNTDFALHRSNLQVNLSDLVFATLYAQINCNSALVFLLARSHNLPLSRVDVRSSQSRQIFNLFPVKYIM